MWKGYRGAQLGWILTPDAVSTAVPDTSVDGWGVSVSTASPAIGVGLYLVIFAPARERVEVWRARFGPRVRVVPVANPASVRLVSTCSAGVTAGADLPVQSRCFLLTAAVASDGGGKTGRAGAAVVDGALRSSFCSWRGQCCSCSVCTCV